MKEHRLLQQLGHIDDDLIEEAGQRPRFIHLYRFGSIAVAAAVLAVAVLLPWGEWTNPVVPDESTTTQQTEPSDETADNAIGTVDTTTASEQTTTAKKTTVKTTESAVATTTQANSTTVKTTATTYIKPTTTDGTMVSGQTTTMAKNTTITMNGLYTTTVKPTATTYIKDPELALIPKWEDKTIRERYPEIPYGAATYSVYYPIDPKNVGEKLHTATATGQDVYTDTYHTTSVTLYRLADIAPQCAVAIRYEGDDDYYSAVATWYQPVTLGEFLDGLQLKKYGKFGDVSWDYFEDGVRHYRTYDGVGKDAIFDLLLDDTSLPNVYDHEQWFYDTINISVDLPILGLENPVVIMLSEDGYLFTNILGCGKTFYIGTDRVEAFKAYVQKNGTPTEYTHPTTATSQEDASADSTTSAMKGTTRTSAAYIPE